MSIPKNLKGFNVKEATPELKTEYVKWRIHVYDKEGWQGSLLSEYLAQDYEDWTVDHLKDVDKDSLRSFRGLLRDFGVYVPVGRAMNIATAIKAAIDQELTLARRRKATSWPQPIQAVQHTVTPFTEIHLTSICPKKIIHATEC